MTKAKSVTSKRKQKLVDRLKLMPSGNRGITRATVRNLEKSIRRYGILRSVVVVKTNIFHESGKPDAPQDYYIADGQHLWQACMNLNMLDQLTVIENKDNFDDILSLVQFVSVLNTTQSPWRVRDFIYAYSSTHKMHSYTRLIEKRKSTGLGYTTIAIIYGRESRSTVGKTIKSGNFRMQDEAKGDEIAEIVKDVQSSFGRSNSRSLYTFTYVLASMYEKKQFVKETFRNFVKDNAMEFINTMDEVGMRGILERYEPNYKSAAPNLSKKNNGKTVVV